MSDQSETGQPVTDQPETDGPVTDHPADDRALVEWSVATSTGSAEETRGLAAGLAAVVRPGDVLLLVGGLGAGKTTFAQGFARGLGVAGPVTSPTFTLVRHYEALAGPPGVHTLLHADVYRLDSPAEVADLGLPELVEDRSVALVEWGDRAAPVLGESALEIRLDPGEAPTDQAGDEPRRVLITGRGPAWAGRRPAVAAAAGVPGTTA